MESTSRHLVTRPSRAHFCPPNVASSAPRANRFRPDSRDSAPNPVAQVRIPRTIPKKFFEAIFARSDARFGGKAASWAMKKHAWLSIARRLDRMQEVRNSQRFFELRENVLRNFRLIEIVRGS